MVNLNFIMKSKTLFIGDLSLVQFYLALEPWYMSDTCNLHMMK